MPRTIPTRRIMVTLPQKLIDQLDAYVAPHERSELVIELLEAYLDDVSAQEMRAERSAERREAMSGLVERLRESGKRAADILLP